MYIYIFSVLIAVQLYVYIFILDEINRNNIKPLANFLYENYIA